MSNLVLQLEMIAILDNWTGRWRDQISKLDQNLLSDKLT